ncbi:hypothetical protein AAFF_G00046920 [Aldrovandia affinis]|uniref:MHC class II alpha chain N-terminal domain-containing protein n=1 Tax=Aldrovandia affinis TaxID=143900 RepID=A0AAD7R2L9_9TELE|nr:hypothetical protein AAFF_G00046920 [Aldrovandia affinis]
MKLRMNYSMVTAVLLGVVCVLVKVEGHIDNYVVGCKTNDTDSEDDAQLDGNEMFYVEFKNKEAVMTLPKFVDDWKAAETWVQQAQAQHQICLSNLNVAVKAEQSPPEEIGENSLMSETNKHTVTFCFNE